MSIENQNQQALAAKRLAQQFQINVLVKGGHMAQAQSSDVVYNYANNNWEWFHAARITSKNTHGTGCSLSSAIASYLAQGDCLKLAIERAKAYLTQAILSGKTQQIGTGGGPIDHFYFLER